MITTDIICPAKHGWATFDQIELPTTTRPYNATEVVALKASIEAIGLQTPLTVVECDTGYRLIAGRHRLEALRLLKQERVPVRIVDFDDVEARLWQISENLHRAELTVTQRAQQIAEWIKLTEEKASQNKLSQVETVSRGGRGNESGVNAAARELGIGKSEAHRAVKIASIAPAAKEALRAAKLDDNQSVALKVASYADDDQVEVVAEIVAEREAKPAVETARPLRDLVNISGGELARWIKITTPNDRPHVIRVLRMAADILESEGADATLPSEEESATQKPDRMAADVLEGEQAEPADGKITRESATKLGVSETAPDARLKPLRERAEKLGLKVRKRGPAWSVIGEESGSESVLSDLDMVEQHLDFAEGKIAFRIYLACGTPTGLTNSRNWLAAHPGATMEDFERDLPPVARTCGAQEEGAAK